MEDNINIELKEVICEIYESIKQGSFTPRLTELVEKYRNEIEAYNDIQREKD